MFRNNVLFCAVLIGCSSAFGEISKKELKAYSKVVRLEGSQALSDGAEARRFASSMRLSKDKEYEFLRMDFSGGDRENDEEYLKNIRIRFLFEITDKREKTVYYVEKEQAHGTFGNNLYTGEGYWLLAVPSSERIPRLKISASVLQYGVMDGDVFVPFCEECDGVKSREELFEGAKDPFPEDCPFTRVYFFSNY